MRPPKVDSRQATLSYFNAREITNHSMNPSLEIPNRSNQITLVGSCQVADKSEVRQHGQIMAIWECPSMSGARAILFPTDDDNACRSSLFGVV